MGVVTVPTLLHRDEPHGDGFVWEVIWPRPRGSWPVRLRHRIRGAAAYGVYEPEADTLTRVWPEEDASLPALGGLLRSGDLVAYRPGRRATVRLRDAGEALYVKVYRPGRAAAAWNRVRAAAAALGEVAGSPALPELIEADLSTGTLIFRAASGRPLHGLTTSGTPLPSWTVDLVALSLARVHAASGSSLLDRDLPIPLSQYAQLASDAFPTERRLILCALREVDALPEPAIPRDRLLHGDLHDRNVLLQEERVTLLDLDLARAGDPVEDVSNLAAHLVLRGLQSGRGFAGRTEAARLVRSYRRAGGEVDEVDVRLFGARVLLRLACLYRFRRLWRQLTPTLAREAVRWGAEGSLA